MKRTVIIITGLILLGLLIFGLKLNSDLSKIKEAFHSEHSLNDPNFVLLRTKKSPDRKNEFYEYHFDNGGFGYSGVFWSVIKKEKSKKTKLATRFGSLN